MTTTTQALTDSQRAALTRLAEYAERIPDGYGVAGHPRPRGDGFGAIHTGTAQALVRRGLAEVAHYRRTGRSTGVTYYAITAAGRDALAS